MDVNKNTSSSRTQNNMEEDCGDSRLITDLPEDITHKIISFLNPNDMGHMSVLSKTLQQVCLSSLFLDFSSEPHHPNHSRACEHCIKFSNFLNWFMSRRGENHIQSFILHWDCHDTEDNFRQERLRLDSWIRKAVDCNVEEIKLNLDHNKPYNTKRPPFFTIDSLSNCKSLRVAELDLNRNNLELRPVALGSLEVLTLRWVSLKGELSLSEWTSTCCPSLKKLELHHVSGSEVFKNHTIETLTMKFGDSKECCINILGNNLAHLSVDIPRPGYRHKGDCSLKLVAPRLQVLELKGTSSKGVDVGKLAALTKATIKISQWEGKTAPDSSIRLVKNVNSVEVLCLHISLIVDLFQSKQFPIPFENLNKLSVILNYWDDYINPLLGAFTSNMPSLTTLVIKCASKSGYHPSSWEPKEKKRLKSKASSYCKIRPCVKEVEIELAHGEDNNNGIKLAEYFLKTMDFLETMTIYYPSCESVGPMSCLLSEAVKLASSMVTVLSKMRKYEKEDEEEDD